MVARTTARQPPPRLLWRPGSRLSASASEPLTGAQRPLRPGRRSTEQAPSKNQAREKPCTPSLALALPPSESRDRDRPAPHAPPRSARAARCTLHAARPRPVFTGNCYESFCNQAAFRQPTEMRPMVSRLPASLFSRSHVETKRRHGSFCDLGCNLAAQDVQILVRGAVQRAVSYDFASEISARSRQKVPRSRTPSRCG